MVYNYIGAKVLEFEGAHALDPLGDQALPVFQCCLLRGFQRSAKRFAVLIGREY